MLDVVTSIAAAGWNEAGGWEGKVALAARAAVRGAAPFAGLVDAPAPVELSVLLTGDDEVRALNRQYRGRDKATNVLSFPMLGPDEIGRAATLGQPVLLGDLALAFETVCREARAKEIGVADHATHLVVHGVLHLLGYDHEEDGEAALMEGMEKDILARLGIADPYLHD